MSLVFSLILIAIAVLVVKLSPFPIGSVVVFLVIAILLLSALFVVRSYDLDGDRLLVRRLLWLTIIDIRGLTDVWRDPNALRGSVRVFGNGGLFALNGLFWSRSLGYYRVFATDPKKSVVMALPKRKIVISPADPETFVRAALAFMLRRK